MLKWDQSYHLDELPASIPLKWIFGFNSWSALLLLKVLRAALRSCLSCSVCPFLSSGECTYSSSLILHNNYMKNFVLCCWGNRKTLLCFRLITGVGLLIIAFLRTINSEKKEKQLAEVKSKVTIDISLVSHSCLYQCYKEKAAMAWMLRA